MNDMTCVRCQAVVSPQLIDFLGDGAVCRNCIIAAESNPDAIARGERDLMRSMGRRDVVVGVIMLAVGIAILSLGLVGSSSIVVLPFGLVVGGIVELVRGIGRLS